MEATLEQGILFLLLLNTETQELSLVALILYVYKGSKVIDSKPDIFDDYASYNLIQ